MNCRDIVLENNAFRLVISEDCQARSLILKATGEECLMQNEEIALFSVTQDRPFNNEVKLAHPNKRTTFQANRVRREGNQLIVGFEITPFEAVIGIKEEPGYIAFTLDDFIVHPTDYEGLAMSPPPVAEMRILQLPVVNRENFGHWLNVSWDEKAAVNVLATSPYARIDSERRKGYRILTADAVRGVKLRGCGAVLIVSQTDKLLDSIAVLEEDYGLFHGVQARRGEKINASAMHAFDLHPGTVDEYIKYAKQGGFSMMLVYYPSLYKCKNGYGLKGDYDFRPEYPNGVEDLKKVLRKIKEAGITPGFHFLHTHIGLWSRYVTPVADHRLNLTRNFTLARPVGKDDDVLYVEQNPEDTVMHEKCRVLMFGGELISYEAYTTERPYRFTGCRRGAFDTNIVEHPMGQIGGILDISEFGAVSCYLDQNSSLQDEVAEKLALAYNAGFEFVYFDGSEGTNPPFEFHVPNAQYRVLKKFDKEPLFTEGAAKAHFSWHHLSGGNAFDVFVPSIFKEKIAEFPCEEAPRMRQDFTRLNFGWWGYWYPGQSERTEPGTQPDMIEYGTSRAAAWDCPVTVSASLDQYRLHPRSADNLEVMRRWEDVRAKKWLTEEQKLMLRDLKQEHILLINEAKEYELVPYEQISGDTLGNRDVRAFVFERGGERLVVYWHYKEDGKLKLPLDPKDIAVCGELYEEAVHAKACDVGAELPIGGRRYIRTRLSREALAEAFAKAELAEMHASGQE